MERNDADYRFATWPLSARGSLAESFRNGQRHGWTIAWYESGMKACEGSFVDGVEDGWWVFWNEDGSPVAAIEFDRGTPCRPILRSVAVERRAA